jgi:hypothetical protein
MIDSFNIPNNDLKTQVFLPTNSGINSWQTWSKPANSKMISIFMIGGGGGGGGGAHSVSSTRVGGTGGGSSSITNGIFPSILLPDTLYINVGTGGDGGTIGGNGGSGSLSYLSVQPNIIPNNLILVSGGIAATGGNGSASGGGAAGTIFSNTQAFLSFGGLFNSIAGQLGAAGLSTAGTNITVGTIPLTGGAGGGGVSTGVPSSGGSINQFSFIPRINGGITATTFVSQASDGYNSKIFQNNISNKNILLFTGGAGGYSSVLNSGGSGGAGSYGCGGGGGGAGSNTVPFSGGTGGRGGDGLVIITCW